MSFDETNEIHEQSSMTFSYLRYLWYQVSDKEVFLIKPMTTQSVTRKAITTLVRSILNAIRLYYPNAINKSNKSMCNSWNQMRQLMKTSLIFTWKLCIVKNGLSHLPWKQINLPIQLSTKFLLANAKFQFSETLLWKKKSCRYIFCLQLLFRSLLSIHYVWVIEIQTAICCLAFRQSN